MLNQIQKSFLFYTFTLFVYLNSFSPSSTAEQIATEPGVIAVGDNYIFETIAVPGVDFLAVAASSDFEDYAGYTPSPDGQKMVAFTLIDGVFKTYDYPGSLNTYFYALDNNWGAAGYYEDSNGLHHGVILTDGELRQYDFPDAVETEIYGISDETGALTGNFIAADGIRRGFTGDTIIEFPGASETYADFVVGGHLAGSYVDADGIYHIYLYTLDGKYTSIDVLEASDLEYLFVHGINAAGVHVLRTKRVGDVPRTYVGTTRGREELHFPGSVSTEGYNINQDGSVVGHYESTDGRIHGFIARPVGDTTGHAGILDYTFETIDVPGVEVLRLSASSDFEDYAGSTPSPDGQKMVAFTLIDGVFETYDFPGSKHTYFYALGNNGDAAGYYEDSDGLHHGVILQDKQLRQYDFPGAVETEIWGISDATGALTGNFIAADGIRRGFTGDTIIEFPGAMETYADFVAAGRLVGSYVDADGIYYGYGLAAASGFSTYNVSDAANVEYFFIHGVNDVGTYITRTKRVGDVPRTHVGSGIKQKELYFPGSISTEGYNINQDGSIVGHYTSTDGRIHGFIARPAVATEPVVPPVKPDPPATDLFEFETIDVPGVDFLALTASSDFEDYAGYTRSPGGEKEVAFTLIDGIFETYDFPGSQKTHFYALGNNGIAAGHYQDSDGLYHGVILENGELRQYDFPSAVQTEIYGYSDSTGALTGNYIDASGIRRGFSGDAIVEFPGASETYADFVNAQGSVVGSYVDAEGTYHVYLRGSSGSFASIDFLEAENLEYFFLHGLNDVLIAVGRAKAVGDVPRTYVGNPLNLRELRLPGSVSTEGWNINQDGSVVGHYDSADGRRHGFIARPTADTAVRPVAARDLNYTFESIDVPGIEFLAVTASNDFEDYAGNTRSADGEKMVGFTLIDGVFTTHDFPGAQSTYFYALGNDGTAAGHYQDSDGLYHGVILENGELRQYDFPGAVQTEIYGYSDSTGTLTGNFTDASGIRRGFSGDTIVEFPGASATYADFVASWTGNIVGSYIDAEGIYHTYLRGAGGTVSVTLQEALNLEYFFLHGLSARTVVGRAKAVGDVPRTYFGDVLNLRELRFPGSVSTEGWNINQDGSIVGHYDSADGRRHGFIARPTTEAVSDYFSNVFNVTLAKGLNMISVPLAPPTPMTAKTLAALTGATTVITLDTANQQFVGWTPSAPDDGFPIEGGQGYIVNVPNTRQFAYVGSRWTNQTETAAAPSVSVEPVQEAWAFVVSGHLEGKPAFDGYQVVVRNLRTDRAITASVRGDYFAAATADLSRRGVVEVGDVIEVHVIGLGGNVESHTLSYEVTPEDLANAVLSIRLDGIGKPKLTQLLQNFPNPFNPETWIPYQLETSANVTLRIYDTKGGIVRTLNLGFKPQGFYMTRSTAAYWDGRNNMGEQVASGVYFYSLQTPDFSATRKMLILK